MKGYPIDLVGKRFGKLIILSKMESTPSGTIWLCQCDCGGVVRKMTTQLRRSKTMSYGCRNCESSRRSLNSSLNKNGNCKGGKTRLYIIWKGMRQRCGKIYSTSWRYYGAKGISVCEEWNNYTCFRQWAMSHGYEDLLTIDRINPAGNYTPGNCRWVTRSENSKRVHVK